jgi:hypothetical protein
MNYTFSYIDFLSFNPNKINFTPQELENIENERFDNKITITDFNNKKLRIEVFCHKIENKFVKDFISAIDFTIFAQQEDLEEDEIEFNQEYYEIFTNTAHELIKNISSVSSSLKEDFIVRTKDDLINYYISKDEDFQIDLMNDKQFQQNFINFYLKFSSNDTSFNLKNRVDLASQKVTCEIQFKSQDPDFKLIALGDSYYSCLEQSF